MNKLSLILFGIIFTFSQSIFSQDIPGCTDPQANNYNPQATINDGSCLYDQTTYAPALLYQLPEEVNESSGLIFYNGSLWTINDSGNSADLYRIDSADGSIIQRITISDALNIDWESLAQDDENIYIGDIGNNAGNRDNLGIYIVKKSDLPETGDGEVESEQISFTYSDFTNVEGKLRDTDFDCEAMISVSDSLYLFSKNWVNNQTKLYRLSKSPGEQVAEFLITFNTQGLITGADYNETSKEITLVGYTENTYTPFLWLLFDYNENQFFSGNKRRIDMISMFGTQTEGVCYKNGKNATLSNEANVLYQQSAYNFYTSIWTDTVQTGIFDQTTSDPDFILKPNPISRGKLTIKMAGFQAGEYRVEIYSINGNLIRTTECSVLAEKSECKPKVNVDDLVPGLYFIRLYAQNTIIEKKFIKK